MRVEEGGRLLITRKNVCQELLAAISIEFFLIASQRSVDFNRKIPPRVDKMFTFRAFIAQLSEVWM